MKLGVCSCTAGQDGSFFPNNQQMFFTSKSQCRPCHLFYFVQKLPPLETRLILAEIAIGSNTKQDSVSYITYQKQDELQVNNKPDVLERTLNNVDRIPISIM